MVFGPAGSSEGRDTSWTNWETSYVDQADDPSSRASSVASRAEGDHGAVKVVGEASETKGDTHPPVLSAAPSAV